MDRFCRFALSAFLISLHLLNPAYAMEDPPGDSPFQPGADPKPGTTLLDALEKAHEEALRIYCWSINRQNFINSEGKATGSGAGSFRRDELPNLVPGAEQFVKTVFRENHGFDISKPEEVWGLSSDTVKGVAERLSFWREELKSGGPVLVRLGRSLQANTRERDSLLRNYKSENKNRINELGAAIEKDEATVKVVAAQLQETADHIRVATDLLRPLRLRSRLEMVGRELAPSGFRIVRTRPDFESSSCMFWARLPGQPEEPAPGIDILELTGDLEDTSEAGRKVFDEGRGMAADLAKMPDGSWGEYTSFEPGAGAVGYAFLYTDPDTHLDRTTKLFYGTGGAEARFLKGTLILSVRYNLVSKEGKKDTASRDEKLAMSRICLTRAKETAQRLCQLVGAGAGSSASQDPLSAAGVKVKAPRLGCSLERQGTKLIITAMDPGSPLAGYGVQAGDELLGVGEHRCDEMTMEEIEGIIRSPRGRELPVMIARGDKEVFGFRLPAR